MKKWVIPLLFCSALLEPFVGQGQDTTGFATVYFIREPTLIPGESLLQYALNYLKVYINSALVCSLNEKRFSVHKLPPGRHTIRVYARNTNPKRDSHEKAMIILPGKTYYIALDFHGYKAPTPIVIHPLADDLAQVILPSLKQDKSCTGRH